jgi:hypothetical protein
MVETYRAEIDIVMEEQQMLLSLLPGMELGITKNELYTLIKESYSNEQVDMLEDHIGWRLFQFWFSTDDILEEVIYDS